MGKHIEKDMGAIMDVTSLGALFEPSSDAVVGVKDNKICFANPAAQGLFALTVGEATEAHFPAALFEGEEKAAALEINDRPAEVSVRRVEDITLLYLRTLSPDGTDEAMTPTARLVRGLSDSLINLRMALDALLKADGADEDEGASKHAAVLYREYYRMRRLCVHLSAADNLAQGALFCSFAALDLAEELGSLVDSVKMITAELGVDIRFRCECGDYITEADGAGLETMLLNLLSNSLLRCDRGGCITVSLRRAGAQFLLSVDDNGHGMSAETLSGALHGVLPYDLRDNRSGAGLGLTIAKGIVRAHGGTLILESREGEGCHVRVSLPQRKPEKTLLHSADPVYEVKDMNGILTELSVVLPTTVYRKTFFD